MVLERYYQNIYYDNLGISYSSPTFTIHGANGRDLGPANPAIIFLPSKASPGQFTRYKITANQTFDDASGTSDIAGNLFGWTTSIAVGEDCPFFIYAVTNDDEDTIQFMISRVPQAKESPAAASIGAPDDAVADSQFSFWSLSNIDETLYNNNPCICIGSFRMQMSASDDWTVQAISTTDGIGQFQEGIVFTMPVSQNGAASGKYFSDNGGTAPSFSTNNYNYLIHKSGVVDVYFRFLNATAGVGAVTAILPMPYLVDDHFDTQIQAHGSAVFNDDSDTNAAHNGNINVKTNLNTLAMVFSTYSTAVITNAGIDTNDDVGGKISYTIKID